MRNKLLTRILAGVTAFALVAVGFSGLSMKKAVAAEKLVGSATIVMTETTDDGAGKGKYPVDLTGCDKAVFTFTSEAANGGGGVGYSSESGWAQPEYKLSGTTVITIETAKIVANNSGSKTVEVQCWWKEKDITCTIEKYSFVDENTPENTPENDNVLVFTDITDNTSEIGVSRHFVDITGYESVTFDFDFTSTWGGGGVQFTSNGVNVQRGFGNEADTTVTVKAAETDDNMVEVQCWWINEEAPRFTCTVTKTAAVITPADEKEEDKKPETETEAKEEQKPETEAKEEDQKPVEEEPVVSATDNKELVFTNDVNKDKTVGVSYYFIDLSDCDSVTLDFAFDGTWGGGGVQFTSNGVNVQRGFGNEADTTVTVKAAETDDNMVEVQCWWINPDAPKFTCTVTKNVAKNESADDQKPATEVEADEEVTDKTPAVDDTNVSEDEQEEESAQVPTKIAVTKIPQVKTETVTSHIVKDEVISVNKMMDYSTEAGKLFKISLDDYAKRGLTITKITANLGGDGGVKKFYDANYWFKASMSIGYNAMDDWKQVDKEIEATDAYSYSVATPDINVAEGNIAQIGVWWSATDLVKLDSVVISVEGDVTETKEVVTGYKYYLVNADGSLGDEITEVEYNEIVKKNGEVEADTDVTTGSSDQISAWMILAFAGAAVASSVFAFTFRKREEN